VEASRFVPVLFLIIALAILACGPEPPLSDGEYFGFARDVTEDALVFDPADFLSGEEALAAAREDGVIGPTEQLDDDFYIRNPQKENLGLDVDPGTPFTLLVSSTSPISEETVTYSELVRLWQGIGDTSPYYGPLGVIEELGSGMLPLTIIVRDGRVESAKQFYLP
jgi:hypothetical protein